MVVLTYAVCCGQTDMTTLPLLSDKETADLLSKAGVITETSVSRALSASQTAGTSVDVTLLELGLANEEQMYRTIAQALGLPFAAPDSFDPSLLDQLPLSRSFLLRARVIPIHLDADTVTLATSNLRGQDEINSVAFRLKQSVKVVISTPSSIKAALSASESHQSEDNDALASEGDVARLKALANDGPVIKLVNEIITQAVDARASDVHIEAQETGARVRFRVDGKLQTARVVANADRAAVASRLKVMAALNISEKRRPQDGRAQLSVRGRTIDLRLSTLPTQFGESIVLRILDRERVALDWEKLGFEPSRVAEIEQIIRQPNGIFLIAGPTGSGKTTTLYTALSQINQEDRKIVTVEDPIEYSLEGINQVQVEPQIDMTFARALRAILRQDPDVVMVGEIRDEETAQIAVRAALIGRLVLSTIHTNDSIAAVDRLGDLGVPAYMIAATLRGVLSQRLVPMQDGSEGRNVVSELFTVNKMIAAAISAKSDYGTLVEVATANGFVSLDNTLSKLG